MYHHEHEHQEHMHEQWGRRGRGGFRGQFGPGFGPGMPGFGPFGGALLVGNFGDGRITAFDASTGRILWETRLPAAVQGFPVTFTAGGKQYLAVTTSNGGGSPRGVPAVVAAELHYPATGNALYVFALPDRR